MKVFVTSVFDSKMKLFYIPKFYVTLGQAERTFGDDVNNPQQDMFKHAEDYSLFHIGFYNDETGMFENLTAPQQLVSALSVKKDS